jgi:hypothetical protein
MRLRSLRGGLLTLACLLVAPVGLWAAGNWSTLPIVGSPSVCVSNVSGTGGTTAPYLIIPGSTQGTTQGICGQVMPAGPIALTGSELIPADTGLALGAPPQTVVIPSGLLGPATNRLVGSNFDTNLAQRLNTTKGVAALATLSPTAAVITADRWWVIAPAAGVTATIDSTAATATVPGLSNTKALRIARTSSGAAGIICVGQTLDKVAAAPLIGNNAIFSFYEESGATAPLSLTVNVDYFTAADTAGTQATLGFAGGNGSLAALGDVGLASAGPTNFTRAIAGVSPGTTGTVSAGVATLPVAAASTWNRYAVYAPIPVNAPGTTTPVTGVSVSICWTPTATTAVTTDWIEIEDAQLEAASSAVTANLPAGIVSPKAYQNKFASVEQQDQYYYWYFNYENQSLLSPVANTSCISYNATTGLLCNWSFPVAMRITPAVKFTDGFQALSAAGPYTGVTALSSLAIYTNTLTTVANNTGFMLKGTGAGNIANGAVAVGTATILMSLGTASATGIVSASAEP